MCRILPESYSGQASCIDQIGDRLYSCLDLEPWRVAWMGCKIVGLWVHCIALFNISELNTNRCFSNSGFSCLGQLPTVE